VNNIFKLLLTVIVVSQFNLIALAQSGGNNTYEFLNLTNSARIAALGGNYLVVKDDDINLVLSNPSLISAEMNNFLNLSFIDYYSDIKAGYTSYSRTFEKYGSFAASLQFLDYGKFTYADATGETYGEFKAGEYAMTLGWGRPLDTSFSIGANLKFIYSDFEDYKSFGLATDVAGTYHSAYRNFSASLILRNMGRQIVKYRSDNREPLPFEIQFGMSKKLAHTPIRFSFLATNLQKWDLTYEDPRNLTPVTDPVSGDTLPGKVFEKFLDKAMRHTVFGAEFSPAKSFSLRIGYNYRRRKEMKVNSKPGLTGLSWGVGVKVSRFRIDYGRAIYHLAGAPNNLSLTINLTDIIK